MGIYFIGAGHSVTSPGPDKVLELAMIEPVRVGIPNFASDVWFRKAE